MIAKNIVITREAENIENAKKNASAGLYKKNEVIPYTLLHSFKHLAIVNVNTEKFALQDSKRMMPYLSFNFMHAAATGFRIFHRHGIYMTSYDNDSRLSVKKMRYPSFKSKCIPYTLPEKQGLSLPFDAAVQTKIPPPNTDKFSRCVYCLL